MALPQQIVAQTSAKASAVYVGNNKSKGIEAHLKYAKRDTVASSWSNMSMSLEMFTPSPVKFVVCQQASNTLWHASAGFTVARLS